MRSEPSLYRRLSEFALDDPSASFKFSDRLARENGWTLDFAKNAIGEYKKFLYLAAVSQTPLTPSDVVDQVWHLHLTYTRSYWSEMCAGVLGKPLHHGPTKGGASEDMRYRTLYAETLDAYRREFGTEPPQDYWPAPGARFESALHQRWIDTRTHAVIAWRTITRSFAAAVAMVTLSSAGAAFAAAEAKAEPEKIWIGLGAVGLLGIVFALSRMNRRGGRSSSSGDGGAYYGGDAGGTNHHGGHGGHHGGHGDSGGHGSCSGGGGDGGGSGCSGGGGCSSS